MSGAERCHEEGVIYSGEARPKSTHIDIGGGRVWSWTPAIENWIEMPKEYNAAGVRPCDIERDAQIRALTAAEVARAERGLGPVTCRDCGAPGEMVDEAPPGESGDVIRCSKRCDLTPPGGRFYSRHVRQPVVPPCSCGGAGCSGPADIELHQGDTNAAPATLADVSGGCARCATGNSARSHTCERAMTVPAGLTPEQAARYQDATATTLRHLVALASSDLAAVYVRFFAHLDESLSSTRGKHDDLAYAHASYVVSGIRRWEPDDLGPMMSSDAIDAIRSALAAVSS